MTVAMAEQGEVKRSALDAIGDLMTVDQAVERWPHLFTRDELLQAIRKRDLRHIPKGRKRLVTEAWLAGLPDPLWRGDAMEQLRQIQRHASLPLPVRQAAERLSTTMPRRYAAPFTIDPLADARVIIEYLAANTEG